MRKRAKTGGVLALAAVLALGACGGSEEAGPAGSAGSRSPEPVDIEAVDIAFTRFMHAKTPFGADIVVMSADGSNKANLTRTREASEEFLAWSTDGTQIAYSRQVGKFGDIWVMNVDGSGKRNVTETPRGKEYGPAWSPDGKQIVFNDGNNRDLFAISPDGGERTNLTKSPKRAEGSPAFSPDGRRIVFSRSYGIFVINSDGTAERKLSDKLGSPTFSPDGKRIAFRVRAPSGEYARVWIMNADGSGAAPLAHGPRIGTASGSGPDFSPDGRQIAYVGANPRRPGIYVMKADGTKRVRLTKHAGDATPVWRPVAGR